MMVLTICLLAGCNKVDKHHKLIDYTFKYDSSLIVEGIPVPSLPQLRWHNYEQIMFIHFNPTTWTGKEYDDLSLPINRMNPTQLNTDQWCEVAKSWDAKMILFVAKHTGGFCWWQTETSDYGIKNTPWKDGKGDVLAELSKSCQKYGLDLGIYVYPGDEKWDAGIGSGGRTKDPSKQEDYNFVFRQQLTEVLTKYGPIREVWFDGSCIIDVGDIIDKYASDAVVFQGPKATIRWVGNEDGIAPYPNWYTIKKEDLQTGVSTALHSTPDGDAYAPVEIDLPLLGNKGHKWFWAPNTDSMILSADQLMDVYYRTVGRGGIMLLNSTPDTTGLIPDSHVKIYKAFGEEIKNRFDKPIESIFGIDSEFEISLEKPTIINHAIIQEEIAYGQRVRSYSLEGLTSNGWKLIYSGSSIGTKKIDSFDSIEVSKIRLKVDNSIAQPIIKNFSVYYIKDFNRVKEKSSESKSSVIGSWNAQTFTDQWQILELDLTPYIDFIGQFEVNFQMVSYDWNKEWGLEFKDWEIEMYGKKIPEAIQKVENGWKFIITRSQQVDKMDEYPSIFRVKIKTKPGLTIGNIELKKIEFR
ncbi:MAG: alpha-L-fucosidase [Tenuifilaceae bacterium]